MQLRLAVMVLLLPLLFTVCAWAAQSAPELLPAEPTLRVLLYLGSLCIGGYLVVWLTRWLAPQMVKAIKEGFDRLLAKLDEGFGRLERKLDEIKESNSNSHRDQFREIREIAARIKDGAQP